MDVATTVGRVPLWRRRAAARGGVGLLGICALVAASGSAAPGGVAAAAAQPVDRSVVDRPSAVSFSFSRQFDIAERSNQQGLAHGGGFLWVCFDTGGGKGKIVKYSLSGVVQKSSPNLPLGHCAEIDYRSRDGMLYAVDYAEGSPTAHLRIVDMGLARPAVVKTIDVTRYGAGQMVAIDNVRDQVVVKGGARPYRFNFFALAGTKSTTRATWLREVRYQPSLGLPQGLEIVGNEMLFSATNFAGGRITNNRIHVLTLNAGYKTSINVPIARESEGLAVDSSNNNLYLGFHKPNSVYRMSPAYQPSRR